MNRPWEKVLRLHELGRGPMAVTLEPDADARAAIARELGLQSLPELTADLTVTPWLDGAEISGRFRAVVGQICGVSLDAFEQPLDGEVFVQAVPAGSANAPSGDGGEMDLDPEAPDPPDVLADDAVDLAAYVVEHLALEIDPFPRKPGATFDYAPLQEATSPFAALKKLQDPKR